MELLPEWVEGVIKARFLVASLGEMASPPWWRSQATSAVGQRMLARLFPRTYLVASLETASRAACIIHDERIGRIGAYHLFRLPTAYESIVADWLRSATANDILTMVAAMEQTEDKLRALAEQGQNATVSAGIQGPVNCGPVDGIVKKATLAAMCATYAAAFADHGSVYPYLEEIRS